MYILLLLRRRGGSTILHVGDNPLPDWPLPIDHLLPHDYRGLLLVRLAKGKVYPAGYVRRLLKVMDDDSSRM